MGTLPRRKKPIRAPETGIFFRALIAGLKFGPGKADLLAGIDETGSLAEAARRMEMSYMRAWQLIKELQGRLKEPAVILARGGGKQGGAQLTESGRALLAAYRELEKALKKSGRRPLAKLAGYFKAAETEDAEESARILHR